MPTVNIFDSKTTDEISWRDFVPELRHFIANELSCNQRSLGDDEISIRLISTNNLAMIAPIEVEINAHAYEARVSRSDEICLSIRAFIKERLSSDSDVRVWLTLADLGHSWEE
jgi:hypothetical protein